MLYEVITGNAYRFESSGWLFFDRDAQGKQRGRICPGSRVFVGEDLCFSGAGVCPYQLRLAYWHHQR